MGTVFAWYRISSFKHDVQLVSSSQKCQHVVVGYCALRYLREILMEGPESVKNSSTITIGLNYFPRLIESCILTSPDDTPIEELCRDSRDRGMNLEILQLL